MFNNCASQLQVYLPAEIAFLTGLDDEWKQDKAAATVDAPSERSLLFWGYENGSVSNAENFERVSHQPCRELMGFQVQIVLSIDHIEFVFRCY